MITTRTDARGRTGARRLPARFAAILLPAALLAACEGDNLFTGGPPGGGSGGPPVVADIVVPPSIDEGARLDVRVRAVAPAGMATIHVRFRRAVDDEQTLPTSARTDTITVDATLQLPAEAKDSVLVVEAFATDREGRVSEILSRAVPVVVRNAPKVSAVLTPGTASMGDTVRIRVTAQDRFGLRSVGYVMLNAAGDTMPGTPHSINVNATAVDTIFTVVLPRSMQPAALRVVGLAVNNGQLRGVSAPLQLSVVDQLPPDVRILTPAAGSSYPLSDSLLVRVHVADSGGVSEVRMKGVAIRRDSLQNTAVVTRYAEKVVPLPGLPTEQAPRDTTVMRFLLPAGDDVSEDVYIIATAKDVAGNTRADTVLVKDGPRIQVLNPVEGSTVGTNRTLLVHVSAIDRSAGLDSIKLVVSGAVNVTFTRRNLFPLQAFDTTFTVTIGNVQGPLNLQPLVWNRSGAGGPGQLVRVNVSTSSGTDTQRPQVSRRITASDRLELTDTMRVTVRATDGPGSGIRRMGLVAVLVPDVETLPRREIYRTTAVFTPPLGGTPERTFTFSLGEAYSELEAEYPRKFTVQVHAYAFDEAGNCGAGVTEQLTALECETINVNMDQHARAANGTPPMLQVTAVLGKSVRLPGGGRIADAVVDGPRRRVYLSNIDNNKIDIFLLGADTFAVTNSQTRRGLVGAAPWGMVISNRDDSLYVANSGGTNISVLPLDGPSWMVEDRRILTPNTVLHDVSFELNEGQLRYGVKVHDFSDRPQFIAQHMSGTMVYSTLPTPAARDGTLRYLDMSLGARPESYILHGNAATDRENSIAIANVDSIVVVRASDGPDLVVLYDHKPGTNEPIWTDPMPLHLALEDLVAQGSDAEWIAGAWNIPAIGLADTTFVAASGNRQWIAFGEGAKAPFGRIFMCCTFIPGPPLKLVLSREIEVRDLIHNAAERVFGIGLNANGTLGVARGGSAAYFFSTDLRLQGEFRSGMNGGSGGASLHPDHSDVMQTGDEALSFVATGNRTIKILDSTHFYQRGEIHIRDNVVGPVRVFKPSTSDNEGLAPGDPNSVVVRLVAVTQGSNVVIINVRRKDIDH